MEKKKVQMSLTGLIVLIILVAVIVGGLVYFFTNYDLQINDKKYPQEMKETEKEELDKDSELIKELYNIVLKYDDTVGSYAWQNGESASFYRDEKITISSLSNIEKILTIIRNTSNIKKITQKNEKDIILKKLDIDSNWITGDIIQYYEVDKEFKKMFGSNIENFILKDCSGCSWDLKLLDNCINEINFFGGGMGNAEYAYSEIQKVEQEGEQIYIYDKYIFVDFLKAWLPEDDELVHIYTSADKIKEIGKEEDNFGFDQKTGKYDFKEIFKKYEDKLNTYKHTFQKAEDGTYYWVSSEIYKVAEDTNNLSKENAEKNANIVLDKYMDLQHFENGGIGPGPRIFAELELMSKKEVSNLDIDIDPSIYTKSNVEYEKFKNVLLNYVTEDYFEKNFSHYTNIDGYVGFCSAAGGIVVTEVEKVTLNKVEENKYIFDVILKDVQMYERYLNPEEGESITKEECFFDLKVTFKLVNDKLVIDEY